MIHDKLKNAVNTQINAELFSSYLYLAMSAWFEKKSLKGFASWMKIQAQEELCHAMILYNYVVERGGIVTLDVIDKPQQEWSDSLEVFEHVYRHEQLVTSLINDLMNLAIDERDHACTAFLQWFVTEQVEEEAAADEIVAKLKLIGKDSAGLFAINSELAARTFILPTPLTGKF